LTFEVNNLYFYFLDKEEFANFASNLKAMMIIGFVLALFVFAIISPSILPNKKVSNHKKDWEV
tara:strand:+ start:144795 stop:144983 length:189 start_codon:yes stop_codon:yes gene_type:complete